MQLLEDIQTVEYIIGYYNEFIAKYQNRRISGNVVSSWMLLELVDI